MSSLEYLPVAVAIGNGYFAEEGVEVKLQKFFSANDRDAALQSGKLDGCILDYTGAALQRAGGVGISLTSQCNGSFELIAGKDVLPTDDFEGKRIAVSHNTVIDFCTDMLLESMNINASKVQRVEINKIPLRLEMLNNAKVDFSVLPQPFAAIACSEGNQVAIRIESLGYNVTGIVFTHKAIEERKEAIKAFYRAYNRAIDYLNDKPMDDFVKILIGEVGFTEKSLSYLHLPVFSRAQSPKTADLEAVAKWLKKRNLLPVDYNIDSIVNPEFVVE
jgi:ABC transporter, substrate-binding protein